jgi:hypothetical protein
MQFAESTEGQHRIFVGALEAPGGEGYIAALVIKKECAEPGPRQVVYRDDSVACGYRWPTPQEAITYAMARGRELVKKRSALAPVS